MRGDKRATHCHGTSDVSRLQASWRRWVTSEMVIQNDPGPTPAKMLDIEMLVMTVGGKERSPEEFRDLLSSAGLRLGCIITTPNPLCVIEAFAN
jgi:hypothetical protein